MRKDQIASEPVSDIDTATADSLKVIDPKRPIREAEVAGTRSKRRRCGTACTISFFEPRRRYASRSPTAFVKDDVVPLEARQFDAANRRGREFHGWSIGRLNNSGREVRENRPAY
jgi:hypothetical protein